MKEEEIKILCPFCSEPYTARMEAEFIGSWGSYTNPDDGDITIDIYCDNCKKLVYKKIINQK